MKFKAIFLSINLLFVYAYDTTSQVLEKEDSYFLTVDDREEYVVFFNSKNKEPDDFLEGNVYLYDVNLETASLLNDEVYILDFVDIHWTKDLFFISNGVDVTMFSFKKNERTILFETNEKETINFIDISDDGNNIIICVEDPDDQNLYYIDFKKDKNVKKVFSLEKKGIDNAIISALINSNGDIYILNIDRQLLHLSISNIKGINLVENDVNEIMLLNDDDDIYFTQAERLILYNIKNCDYLEVLKGNHLTVNFVGNYSQKRILINFIDNTFVYDPEGELKPLNTIKNGRYLYIGEKIAVKKNQKSLTIQKY